MKTAWAEYLRGSPDATVSFLKWLEEQSHSALLQEHQAGTWAEVLLARGKKTAYDSIRLTFTAEERDRVAHAGRFGKR